MIGTYQSLDTPEGQANARLAYSYRFPFLYWADLTDCPPDVLEVLKSIDREMAQDDSQPHAIENWHELYRQQ